MIRRCACRKTKCNCKVSWKRWLPWHVNLVVKWVLIPCRQVHWKCGEFFFVEKNMFYVGFRYTETVCFVCFFFLLFFFWEGEAKLGEKNMEALIFRWKKSSGWGRGVFLSGHDFGGSVLSMCYNEIIEFQIRKLEKLQEERCSPLSRRIGISVRWSQSIANCLTCQTTGYFERVPTSLFRTFENIRCFKGIFSWEL